MLTGFPRTRWPRLWFSESYAVRISVKISRICEFRVIMGIMTGLLGCCSSSTLGSRANDYVKTLATLGFWLHHSPCSLGCWTNNTLAARSLSPKYRHSMEKLLTEIIQDKHEQNVTLILTNVIDAWLQHWGMGYKILHNMTLRLVTLARNLPNDMGPEEAWWYTMLTHLGPRKMADVLRRHFQIDLKNSTGICSQG